MQVAPTIAETDRPAGAPPELPPNATAAERLGAELRARREQLGWTLPALSDGLRIRRPYLEAIELGRVGELPGTAYALGFVRTYANALGLSGEAVAQRFRAEAGEVGRRPELTFPAPVPQRGVPAGAVILLGLLLAAGAYVAWYRTSETRRTPTETVPPIPDRLAGRAPSPSPQVATILPSTAPPPPRPGMASGASPAASPPAVDAPAPQGNAPTAAGAVPPVQPGVPQPVSPRAGAPAAAPSTATTPTAPLAGNPPPPAATHIVLRFTADAWVTVKQRGGPALVSKLMHAGDSFPVPDDKPGLTLTTGNAGGTEIDLDGTAVPGVGGSGMVRRDLPLDPDLLRSGHLPPLHGRAPKPAMTDEGATTDNE